MTTSPEAPEHSVTPGPVDVDDGVRLARSRWRDDSWRDTRRLAYLGYGGAVVAILMTVGIPTQRIVLISAVLVLLAISRIGRGWAAAGAMLRDWIPFAACLLLYDQSRKLGEKLGFPLHEADVLHAEQWLFGGVAPTVWLQRHLYSMGSVHWYDAFCSLVYLSHFLATPILAAVLWLRDRTAWLGFTVRIVIVSVIGLVTYCLFPEAPPWLAARDGLTVPVDRLSPVGWRWLHAGPLDNLVSQAQGEGSNPVAAMPSLHTAFAVLVAIAIAGRIRSRWRWLLVLYPVAMGFTLVYDGEHWVLDLVAGVACALGADAVARVWEARRAARAADRDGPIDPVSGVN